MNRDPYGLGQLLYAFTPGPPSALLAAGMTMTFEHGHDDCGISSFCRNPLHPGPCAGWKRGLGKLAPGALDALEKARRAKVAERRVKVAQAKSTAAGGLTKAQLESPLHAKKSIAKKANQLLGNNDAKAGGKADRVILNQVEIARYSKIKNAQLQVVAAKNGVNLPDTTAALASALARDNSHGRDIAYRATLEGIARTMAEGLAKKLCKKGDGDCDGKAFEDLKSSLEEGLRPAVASGDDAQLEDLVKARHGGQLLTPTGKNPYTPTQPRPARPAPVKPAPRPNAAQQAQAKKAARVAQQAQQAPAAPASTPTPAPAAAPRIANNKTTPGAPGTTPANPVVGRLSDQALVNGVKMHGSTSGQGKDAADELKRRGLDHDGNPLGKPATPAPAKAATPAAPSAPAAPLSAPLQSVPTKTKGKATPGLPGTTAARPALGNLSDQLLVAAVKMHGTKPGLGADASAELKRRGLDLDGNPLSTPAAPSAPAAPAAPAKKAAPYGVTHLQGVLSLGGYTDHELLDALNGITKDEHDTHLSTSEKADIKAELDVMARSSNQAVSRQAVMTRMRLEKGNAKAAPATPAAPAAAPAAPSTPTPSAPLPATASADAKHAAAIASRSAPRSGVAKVQVDAYDKLTKAEFDALPPATQQQILADLDAAIPKFLDPKKKANAGKIRDFLGGKAQANGAPLATPAASPAPSPTAAVPAGLSGGTALSRMRAQMDKHEQLTPADYQAMTPAGRKAVDDDLDMLSNSGTPAIQDRARAQQRVLAGKSLLGLPSNAPALKGDRTPLDPNGPRAAKIAATLAELPADLAPDDQTRQQYVVQSVNGNTWHVGMVGHPAYLQDKKSKAEAMQWIVDAQRSREQGLKANPPASAKAVKAADLTASINESATGTRMNDAAKARLAVALEAEHAKGDGVWAKAFADKAAANIGQKTKGYTQYGLTVGQLDALKAELAAAIDGKRTDTPMLDIIRTSWQGRIGAPDLGKQLDALHAPATPAAPTHGLEAAIDAARGERGPKLLAALTQLRLDSRNDPAKTAAVDAFHAEVINDPKQQNWVRLNAALNRPEAVPAITAEIKKAGIHSQAMYEASNEPSAFPTTYSLSDSFSGVDEAKLANAPDFVKGALYEHRSHVVTTLFQKKASDARVQTEVTGTVFLTGMLGNNKEPDLTRYNTLDADGKLYAKEFLNRQIDNLGGRGMALQASEYQTAIDRIEGTNYDRPQAALIRAMHDRSASWSDKIDAAENITPTQFEALPDAHKGHTLTVLEQVGANPMLNFTERSGALDALARLERNQPDYNDRQIEGVVKQATYWNSLVPAPLRGVVYAGLPKSKFDDLKPADESAVLNDMADIAGDTNVGVPTRLAVQVAYDSFTRPGYTPDQRIAIAAVGHLHQGITNPTNRTPADPPTERIGAYHGLSTRDYDVLPPAYRQAIRDDLEALVVSHPNEAGVELARLDPSWNPPAAARPVATVTNAPHVQAALDVIYGHDPKAKTTARQLQVYTDLPKSDFDSLQPHEQQTMLADLAYIETTSKAAATKTRAGRLLDRFTPPGTPQGGLPPRPVIVAPPNAVKNQTRFPDPGGRTGILNQSTNPGQRGDEWMNVRNSTTRVWGKYGAAGLLLRHIDPQTGEQRFLIAQRGPRISNPGLWQLPGGAIESKETPTEGATRETIEELGFKPSDFATARVHGYHEAHVGNVIGTPTGDWKYTSLAVDVDTKLPPDLSAPGALAETSDAKWMTLAEIDALDKQGKILGPLADGKLQQNIISLFPSTAQSGHARPGPVTQRPGRARPPAPPTAHKPSIATNLIPTAADHDAVSKLVKGPARGGFSGKVADERLGVLHQAQGFDRTPTVKSKREMDDLLATGDYIEIWRGVGGGGGKSATQIAEEFRSGANYNGFGMFGNGYYFASDKAIGEAYAQGVSWRSSGGSGSALIRALLPKSAVTMTHEKIEDEQARLFDSALHRVRQSTKGGRTLHDEGRYATAKGVDAIEVPAKYYKRRGGGYSNLATKSVYVLQNRSTLIVQEA